MGKIPETIIIPSSSSSMFYSEAPSSREAYQVPIGSKRFQIYKGSGRWGIHIWLIHTKWLMHLTINVIFMVNGGKYTIHGCCVPYCLIPPKWLNSIIPLLPVPQNGSFHAKPSDNVTSLLTTAMTCEVRCGSYGAVGGYPPAKAPENRPKPKRKGSSPNPHFSGAMLVAGRVIQWKSLGKI